MQWLSTVLQSFSKPLKWWIVIAAWEQGILVRLGKRVRSLEPGIHFRIPFLDRVYVHSTRLKYVAHSGHTMSSLDGKIYQISVAIGYKIRNLRDVYLSLSDAESTLYLNAISAVSDYVCSTRSDEIIPTRLSEIAKKSVLSVSRGLEIVGVSIIDFAQVKAYRFITGDGWIPSNLHNFETEDKTGER